MYVELLRNISYHNLDESGRMADPDKIIHEGKHAIEEIQKIYKRKNKLKVSKGKNIYDQLFLEPGHSKSWAGHVLWQSGRLTIPHSTIAFPAGRELMYYHRIGKQFTISFPKNMTR